MTLDDLPQYVRAGGSPPHPVQQAVLRGERRLSDAVDAFEHELIRNALAQADQNQTRAAEILGTTRRILKYKMDKLGIAAIDKTPE